MARQSANQAKFKLLLESALTTFMMKPLTELKQNRAPQAALLAKLQPFTLARYHWLVALAAYSVISVIVTFPLIFNLNTSVVGTFAGSDNLQNVWDLWWFKHALEQGHNPNYTNYLFGQLPKVQIFVWTFTNAIAAWPLQYILSYIGVYNLLIFLSFVLSGFCMYLFAGLFLEKKVACFVAGFLFDFSTFHYGRAFGHLGLLTMQVLPFCAYTVFLFYRKPTLKRAILAGVGIALVPLTDAYYLAYFTVPFGLLFVLGILVTNFGWFKVRRNLLLGALAGIIALVLAAPMLISFVMVDPSVQETAKNVADSTTQPLSADLLAYFVPHYYNPLFGGITLPIFQKMLGPGAKDIFLGFSTIILVLGTFWFRQNRSKITLFWLILAIFTIILSLGPKLYVDGQLGIGFPLYSIFYGWSPMSTFRAPYRMSPVPLMALTLLAGYTVNSLLQQPFAARLKWKAGLHVAFAGLLILSIVDSTLVSFPFLSTPVPPTPALYTQIAQDNEDGLVLDMPPFYRIGGYMYYQLFHGKRLVTGYPPRTTPDMYNSVATIPYILPFMDTNLIKTAPLTPRDVFLNNDYTQYFKDSLRDRKITYVILHNYPEIGADNYTWMRSFLTQNLGQPFYDNSQENLVAWHIDSTPPAKEIRVRAGTGWLKEIDTRNDAPSRAISQNGQIIVDLDKARTENLSFNSFPYFQPLTMKIFVNGELNTTVEIKRPGIYQPVQVNGLNLNAGHNLIEIQAVQGCSQPRVFDKNNLDERCFSFGIQQVMFTEAQK
ncbi:MAG: hypothetical protein BGO39_15990 [Chloroflexi bacterium 54-19]|nr:MAG: hypothetical protein BGO39_15990 [Chloroflexi bacterium 54-19]